MIPRAMVEDLHLPVMQQCYLGLADGTPILVDVCMCRLSLSNEDVLDMPIYVCESDTGIALLGMDVLQLCNFSQQHEWTDKGYVVMFNVELPGPEVLL